ncbi:uncharacterized protein SCHCODRAFT_02667310 [Schizophyllum commune H4-8]|uniref:F-box domain-containing protein n=1 Tax=Schizophyllum commune (strain H4-8 / FGSC 9210) TaxID=578458 RepID=D8PL18_SCHCM|nr:uncharacterized protein SCHCODRAFT_02667310 [Schizophyllum commune H4-8]KAI5894277.1 hypothetical protein SCHCODRAFT_02667310 [Schizophyllum commune H4-8]
MTPFMESQIEQVGCGIQDLPLELLLTIFDFAVEVTVDVQLYDFFDVAHNTYRALRDVCPHWRTIVESSPAATWYNNVLLSKQAVKSSLHWTEKSDWVRDYLALSGDAPLNVYLAFTGVTLYLEHVCDEAHRWHTATIVGSPRGAVDYFNMLQTTPAALTDLVLVFEPGFSDSTSILELLRYCPSLQTLRLEAKEVITFSTRDTWLWMVEPSWYPDGVTLPCLTYLYIGECNWLMDTGIERILRLPALKTLRCCSFSIPRERAQARCLVNIVGVLAEHVKDLDALDFEYEFGVKFL